MDSESTHLINRPKPEPHRPVLVAVFRFLNFVTAFSAISVAAAFALSIFLHSEAPQENRSAYFYSGQVICVFGIAFAIMAALLEAELPFMISFLPLLDLWISRGLLHIFLSALTYREAYPLGESDMHLSLQLYRTSSSIAILLCGMTHIFGALLCLGAMRRSILRKEKEFDEIEAEFSELERRRKDLARSLGRSLDP